MRTLNEIDNDLREQRKALEDDNNLDKLDEIEKRIGELTDERAAVVAAAEKRKNLLASIAAGNAGTETRRAAAANTDADDSAEDDDDADGRGTPEYRRAFWKHLTGRSMSAAENAAFERANQRAMTTGDESAGPAVPTTMYGAIIEKLKKAAPIIDRITMLHIAGNVTLTVEGTVADAKAHTQNAEEAGDDDTLVKVVLTGYEIIKLVSISASVRTMTMSGFEAWLETAIAKRVAKKINDWIIGGTGSDEPRGISAITYNAENSIEVGADKALTENDIDGVVGLLPEDYDEGAIWAMSKRTFFADFKPLQNKSKNDTVTKDGGTWYVDGYEVVFVAGVPLHEAYLGDFEQYYGNLSQDVTVAASEHSSFKKNAIDYRGTAIFDGKPAVDAAFVKIKKAAE